MTAENSGLQTVDNIQISAKIRDAGNREGIKFKSSDWKDGGGDENCFISVSIFLKITF